MSEYTISGAVFSPETFRTALTVTGGGMTPNAHKKQVVTFLDGAPEKHYICTENSATVLTVRGDASGETGTHTGVREGNQAEGEVSLELEEIRAANKWARAFV